MRRRKHGRRPALPCVPGSGRHRDRRSMQAAEVRPALRRVRPPARGPDRPARVGHGRVHHAGGAGDGHRAARHCHALRPATVRAGHHYEPECCPGDRLRCGRPRPPRADGCRRHAAAHDLRGGGNDDAGLLRQCGLERDRGRGPGRRRGYRWEGGPGACRGPSRRGSRLWRRVCCCSCGSVGRVVPKFLLTAGACGVLAVCSGAAAARSLVSGSRSV